eukprot:NODE_264_length_12431_cov_0.389556.p2 type:complete len:459 gc:universal NODE_264_length_12431_cov_0.389556:8393-9769(+)
MFRRFQSFVQQWSTPKSGPQFKVGTSNGFLPRQHPILSTRFDELNELLDEMPIVKTNGKPGLLSNNQFGKATQHLPEYDLSKVNDSQDLMALFRDYTFVASAYLLEECDISMRKNGYYGQGRPKLPRNIAVPLSVIAKKINQRPFMEYAQSYALYNYKLIDKHGNLGYENLKLIRAFTNEQSEAGFILTHVAMVQYTPDLVKQTCSVLDAVRINDRDLFNSALTDLKFVLLQINVEMETMWSASKPEDYSRFRTFIFGTKDQKELFPNGVIYEGVDGNKHFYRGESGANDSIIPTMDNLLELTKEMPNNPLTMILQDFRSYRPIGHNEWLKWVDEKSKSLKVREYASEDPLSLLLYVEILDQVRDFRHRHWNFTKEYILKYSNHPVATGGSPIVTWLPNQLSVVLDVIREVCAIVQSKTSDSGILIRLEKHLDKAKVQKRALDKDVESLSKKFNNKSA